MTPRFDSLCPIFLEARGKRPEQIGTAVVLQLAAATFLLTAAHVTDEDQDNSGLLIPHKGGLHGVSGTITSIGLPRTGQRKDDKLDVACIRLDQDVAYGLDPGIIPLQREDLALMDSIHSGDVYTFGGFPWRKTDAKGRVLTTELCSYTGEAADQDIYKRLGYSRAYHVLIRFRRKKSVSFVTGHRKIAPLPHGISGGAVFAWQKDIVQNPRQADLRLCAIAHTYLEQEDILVGTRIGPYLAMIERNWPKLIHEAGSGYNAEPICGAFVGYRREEWKQLLEDFDDAANMHRTWQEWRHAVEHGVEEMTKKGSIMFIVELSAAEIREFCRNLNVPNTGRYRAELAQVRMAESLLGRRIDPTEALKDIRDGA